MSRASDWSQPDEGLRQLEAKLAAVREWAENAKETNKGDEYAEAAKDVLNILGRHIWNR